MKAQELRIGNYVICYNVNIKVSSINDVYLCNETDKGGQYKISDVEPILLTEEWLLKFGFNKDDEKYTKKAGHLYDWDDYSVEKSNTFEDWCFTNVMQHEFIITEIKYVHSLQNLYFALTGKELKIK